MIDTQDNNFGPEHDAKKCEEGKAADTAEAVRRIIAEAFANGALVESRKAAVAAGTEAD